MGFRYKDLTGQTFSNLKVIKFDHTDKKYSYWQCQCLCGNPQIFVRRIDSLKNPGASCGCLWKEKLQINIHIAANAYKEQSRKKLIGQQFNELKVLEFDKINETGGIIWKCQCSCGNIIYATTSVLNSGHTKSCGCIKSFIEKEIANFLLNNNILFYQEYIFKDLLSKNNRTLRFDFALFYNDKLIGLIEYQGQQHYDINSGWYSEDYIERDNQKINYCNINNIPLLILNKENYNTDIIMNFYNRNIGG